MACIDLATPTPQLLAEKQHCSESHPADPVEMAKVTEACKRVWDDWHALRSSYDACRAKEDAAKGPAAPSK